MGVQREVSRVIDNLLTSTWYDVRKELKNDIFQITPFYSKMVDAGRIKERAPDGTHFEIPFAYAKLDQNIEFFGKGHQFKTQEKEFMTNLIYFVANMGDNIVRYWSDERANQGKARILNYVDTIIEAHKAAFVERMADALWVSGGAQAFTTLPSLISTTPTTGTVGGIARSETAYLQNISTSCSGVAFSTGFLEMMEETYDNCAKWKTKGRAAPDVIITTGEIYRAYANLAREMGSYEMNNSSRRVDMGMGECRFKGAEMFWDPNCPSGQMYFLNTASLEFAYDPDNWMEMTEWKSPANSLDRMAQIVAVGNLICTDFKKNAVLHTISTAL